MKIAILGAGVGGIAAAIALIQKGHEVSVYERRKAPSTIGAGIVIWPNGAFVLDRLGVLEQIRAKSGCPMKMQRFSSAGDDLGAIDIGIINKQLGYSSYSILRNDFQNILLAKLHSLRIRVNYDYEVTDITESDNKTTNVKFLNGHIITADLVIGADGRMSSPSRLYVNGDNRPVYQGFINWIGVFESEQELFPQINVYDYWGIGSRFGIVPITTKKAYWAGGIAAAEIEKNSSTDFKTELNNIFSNWPAPIAKIINDSPIDKINKIFVHDLNPIKIWHKGNLVLLGDSAHAPLPTSGQGACQALEDVWELVCSLDKYPENLEETLANYTNHRLEKTTDIINAARSFAMSLFCQDTKLCELRNKNSIKSDFNQVALGIGNLWGRNINLST